MENFGTYFQNSIELLLEFNWIYDFQMTDLFVAGTLQDKFPIDWGLYFKKLNPKDIIEFVLDINENNRSFEQQASDNHIPKSLEVFLTKVKNLLQNRTIEVTDHGNTQNKSKGLSPKKSHEIEVMIPFIKDLCEKHNCKYVIDIGSGLGHLDRFLVNNSEIIVIGVEKESDFTSESNKRNSELKSNEKIINVSYAIHENCEKSLLELIKSKVSERMSKDNSKIDQGNYGIISLHSCGDLTPLMLKIFNENKNDLRFMAAFGCCYHSMKQSCSENNQIKDDFQNFPMSKTLKNVLDKKPEFKINVYGLRLACQQNLSIWKTKTVEDLKEHTKQVGYRAILQKFCSDRNLKMVKLKKKIAGKQQFTDFQTYISYMKERVNFASTDDDGIILENEEIHQSLMNYYSDLEKYFYLIEPLNALQSLLQPILESLIVMDRQAYLQELNLKTRLIKLFDDSLSPRSICILSEKNTF